MVFEGTHVLIYGRFFESHTIGVRPAILAIPEGQSLEGHQYLRETGVRLAICDSLSRASVVLSNDLGASALESQKSQA